MNKAFLTGTLGRDPELRTTQSGIAVCSFTMAVNGRNKDDEATWFRVTAWRQLAENCYRYLSKGKKVCVVGAVSLNEYTGNDGVKRASLEVNAEDVEFLSPRSDADDTGMAYSPQQTDRDKGFVAVDPEEELPF